MCFHRRSRWDQWIDEREREPVRDLFEREPEQPERPTPVSDAEREEVRADEVREKVPAGAGS